MRSTIPGFSINVNNYQRLKQSIKSMKKNCVNSRFCKRSAGNLLKKMKLLITFFFAGLLGVSASTYSQQTKLSIKFDEVTVKEAFKQIEKNSEFVFFYNEDYIDVNRKVNIDLKDESVETILNELLMGTLNTFKIYDRQIVILPPEKKEIPSIVRSETIAEQQKKGITGIVKDNKGVLLPGVSVVVKGTTTGTVTDLDGKFTLFIPEDSEILVFSFVGMKSQEFQITGKTNFNVILTEEAVGLNEVVAIGYGTQNKRAITGSITKVEASKLADMPVTQFAQQLQGKVAGVQIVQTSGQPGRGIDFRIRGAASLYSETQPLFVIDGLPITGSINNINPAEIESFTVLKDASASALYGSRAANGVILITTKHAKFGDSKIEFSSNYGVQILPENRVPQMMTAHEFAQFMKERAEDKILFEGVTTPVDPAYADPTQYGDGTNWYDLLTQTAPIQSLT